jgi:hypothetical protein
MPERFSTRIDRDRLGPTGIDGYLHIVDLQPGDARSDPERFADRRPRTFLVRAVLTKAPSQLESVRGGIGDGEGGCFITAPDDLNLDTPEGRYQISRNPRGELAIATRSLAARSVEEALDAFLAGLTPSLDHLAFISNTPIVVDLLEARDETNHVTTVSYRTPYGSAALSQGVGQLSTPMLPVYAMYREALTSFSNFYRFLCFYKVLEGIFGHIRPQLYRLAREQGISIATRQELVPDDPELQGLKPGYVGRRIHDLYQGELQAQYRHSVAHFALTDGSVASPSSHRESTRYAGIVYLAQVCAREITQAQAEYFSQFVRAGGRV